VRRNDDAIKNFRWAPIKTPETKKSHSLNSTGLFKDLKLNSLTSLNTLLLLPALQFVVHLVNKRLQDLVHNA
jgi:hypothetical protein